MKPSLEMLKHREKINTEEYCRGEITCAEERNEERVVLAYMILGVNVVSDGDQVLDNTCVPVLTTRVNARLAQL